MAHFVVEVMDAHPAGDHTLYIGRVEHFESRDDKPLLFYAGGISNCAQRSNRPSWPPGRILAVLYRQHRPACHLTQNLRCLQAALIMDSKPRVSRLFASAVNGQAFAGSPGRGPARSRLFSENLL